MEVTEKIKHQARLELARRCFWDFEQTLYPEQFTDERKILKRIADTIENFDTNSKRHYLVISLPPGFYKALDVNTPVLTTKGWKNHGDLSVGDYVYSPNGKPVMVTNIHPKHMHEAMEVSLSGGDKIVASTRHQWFILADRDKRKNGKKLGRQPEVVETKDLLGGYHRRRPYIPIASPLSMEEKALPIGPYDFGAWIGDGYSGDPRLSVGEQDLPFFSGLYGNYRKESSAYSVRMPFARSILRDMRVWKNKHIPRCYMEASYRQRLELLRGLMDTDGTVTQGGRCTFVQKSPAIAESVHELCRSLGIKSSINKYLNKVYNRYYYQIGFTTRTIVFNLKRKADRQIDHLEKRNIMQSESYAIKSVTSVGEKLVNCISVEGGLYLAGKGLVPTHNSWTSRNYVLYALGKDPRRRIISASNSHDLAEQFSSQIRDTITGQAVGKNGALYSEVFPDTLVAPGYSQKAKWQLYGSSEPTYRATSPTSTLTGARADVIIIDDVIRNSIDGANPAVHEANWSWFKNTLFSRADGNNYKFIFVMQRWALNDLSGKILEHYGDDVEHIIFPIEKDGVLLDESIVNRNKLDEIKRTLSPEVYEANYMQRPLDVKGRLYEQIKTWDKLPDGTIKNFTDTADTGSDFLCSIDYVTHDKEIYIKDMVFSSEPAEITEPLVTDMLYADGTIEAEFESNNGGRLYARNIERALMDRHGSNKCVIKSTPQTKNKEARILNSAAWVQEHVYFPPQFDTKWPEAYSQITTYQRKGKNPHDDLVDVLATLYEKTTARGVQMFGVR